LNFKRPLKRFVDLANRFKRSKGAITKLISEVIIEPTEEEEDKLAEGKEPRVGSTMGTSMQKIASINLKDARRTGINLGVLSGVGSKLTSKLLAQVKVKMPVLND